MNTHTSGSKLELASLVDEIRQWGEALGFQQIGITDVDLSEAELRLASWLKKGHHGKMEYMSRHGRKRRRPKLLIRGTVSVITARMDYRPAEATKPESLLDHPGKAYVSR